MIVKRLSAEAVDGLAIVALLITQGGAYPEEDCTSPITPFHGRADFMTHGCQEG